MPRRHLQVSGAAEAALRTALRELRHDLGVPGGFPAAVLDEARRAARDPRLPPHDATGIPLFTLDPPGSRDLGQALHLTRRPHGYRVHHALADTAAFIDPGSPLDTEAHHRTATLHFPDTRVPLHPPLIGEGAAALLPGETRPAVLWTIDLDAEGRTTATDVRRALVRSRARLDHPTVQHDLDTDTAEEPLALLAVIGRLRQQQETGRGGISLPVPEQHIDHDTGGFRLTYRAPTPAETHHAQLSLLTGMAAADLMLDYGTGVLRTLPAAPDGAVGRLRRTAEALGIDWPHHQPYAEVVRSLDPHRPHDAAFLQECTTLLRGAGYTVFHGGHRPDPAVHSAVAAPYAHCTAPLRRLADRYTLELCLAAAAGQGTPQWVLAALDALPAEMSDGAHREARAEHACLDLVEAALLQGRVGDTFEGTVVDVHEDDPHTGTVQLAQPAVVARIDGGPAPLPLGERLRVRLTHADPSPPQVRFTPA
ncbi:RNB domain-containing ribonuclease [Streptomyces sp. NPDC058045]|uniref:RNB domain-containing ribonuclease n=1 Tax=Streptomyces sp. NPDC058045 TaxID=3346311 RepID=UPI0036E38C99